MTARTELSRGWRTIVAATLGVAMGASALPFYTAGLFVEPLRQAFGWSRGQLSIGAFVAVIVIVLCAPVAGRLIDRIGVRWSVAVGLAAIAAGFVGLAIQPGAFAVYLVVYVFMFSIGTTSTPISFTRAINERFDRARGLALGLSLCGTGLAAAIAPPIVTLVIERHGWRAAYGALAGVVIVALPLVVWLIGPSSGTSRLDALPQAQAAADKALAPRRLLTNALYLRLAAAFLFLALGVSGYVLHLIPMLTDGGMTAAAAAAAQAWLGIAVIIGRLAIGVSVDRFFAPHVAVAALTVTFVGMATLAIQGVAAASFTAFTIGFAIGAEVDLIGYLTARYFGMAAYGRIYSGLYSMFVLGTGLSPLLIAGIAGSASGYQMASICSLVLIALSIAMFMTMPRFRSKTDQPNQ